MKGHKGTYERRVEQADIHQRHFPKKIWHRPGSHSRRAEHDVCCVEQRDSVGIREKRGGELGREGEGRPYGSEGGMRQGLQDEEDERLNTGRNASGWTSRD